MVYIPWADYGICRYWMLQRCYSGENCQWLHPDPVERKRLWDEHTAKQQLDAQRGIPPPVAPYKSEVTLEKERKMQKMQSGSWRTSGLSCETDGSAPPPPPLPPPGWPPAAGTLSNIGGNMMLSSTNMMAPPPPPNWRRNFPLPSTMMAPQQSLCGLPTAGSAFSSQSGNMPLFSTDMIASPFSPPWREQNQRGADEVNQESEPKPDRVRVLPTPDIQMSEPQQDTSEPQPTLSVLMSSMGATKRLSNGEPKHVGPHPSTIRVSAPYMSQKAIDKKLQQNLSQDQLGAQERSMAEAREDTLRLQGVMWIDHVRRSLQLPIRTYSTACVYYHKFRLAHGGTTIGGVDYSNAWADACAASLLTACKVEDTLKKSRDILAAAYNLKAPAHDHLSADDPAFEAQSRSVIGLERLVLEAGGFDFRSKYPHDLMTKIAKSYEGVPDEEGFQLHKVAWTVLTDMYRTFAPLKMTTQAMALAALELAVHLIATNDETDVSAIREKIQQTDLVQWSTSREEIMETILDLLDLYVQHTAQTAFGPKYSLEDFLRIRLAFNKECNESQIPRYTVAPTRERDVDGNTLRVTNGHPTPVSPMEPGPLANAQNQTANGSHPQPEGGGTLRFMLNPQLAAEEKAEVQKYYVEEWEEYEEEVEVPQPRARSDERERDHERPRDPPRNDRGGRDGIRPRDERDGGGVRDREGRFRDRRYDDRRFDDRNRRFDRFDDDRRRR